MWITVHNKYVGKRLNNPLLNQGGCEKKEKKGGRLR